MTIIVAAAVRAFRFAVRRGPGVRHSLWVLLAIGLSVAELLLRVARPRDAVLGRVPGLAGMHDVHDYPTLRPIPGLVMYRYDAAVFASAADFHHRARRCGPSSRRGRRRGQRPPGTCPPH